MPEIIALIFQRIEVAMEKYGFWNVTLALLMCLVLWKLPEFITSIRWW